MSDPETPAAGGVQAASPAGVAADHPPRAALAGLVAPTPASGLNTLRAAIVPIACWRVEDLLFDFNSSFVKPEGNAELRELKALRGRHAKGAGDAAVMPPVSVFGHADPVGNDDYNKQLSGRRAAAIYGLLVRDAVLWEELYAADSWGLTSVQVMLLALGHDPGKIDGKMGERTRGAVEEFQRSSDVPPDGDPGPRTRKRLFLAYMDKLCGPDFKLDKNQDFLARGEDPGGKGDYQGCGEFNPVLMFSAEEKAELDAAANHEERNQENEPNRRVVVFLFRPGSRVTPALWPCPRAKEGVAGCKKRFWSDADRRRQFGAKRREHALDQDTFACRFYFRIAGPSPCEAVEPVFLIRLYDEQGKFVARAPFRLTFPGNPSQSGLADERGIVRARRVPTPTTGTIEWGLPGQVSINDPFPDFPFKQGLFLRFAGDATADSLAKLNNLGFPPLSAPAGAVAEFQTEYRGQFAMESGGVLGPQTQQAIADVHDGLADDIRNPGPA